MTAAASSRGRKAFTLIEMMIVVAIIGIASTIVAVGGATWNRSARVQKSLNEVMSLLRHAGVESIQNLRPYQIKLEYVGAAQVLTGFKIAVDTSAGTSSFVQDRQVRVVPELSITSTDPSPTGSAWIIDTGGAGLELSMVLKGPVFSYRVRFLPSGDVTMGPAN